MDFLGPQVSQDYKDQRVLLDQREIQVFLEVLVSQDVLDSTEFQVSKVI